MRLGMIVLTIVAASAVTTSSLAALAVKDPKSVALRESDFPVGAHRMSEKVDRSAPLPGGGRGQAYTTTFSFRYGAHKQEIVTITVLAAGNASLGHGVFSALRKEAAKAKDRSPVRLPAYGNEQVAAVTGDVRNDEAGAGLLVRKNTVVWILDIGTDPLAKDFGFSKAQALAELTKYARKQKQRVGNG
jgi:hypothetical protein